MRDAVRLRPIAMILVAALVVGGAVAFAFGPCGSFCCETQATERAVAAPAADGSHGCCGESAPAPKKPCSDRRPCHLEQGQAGEGPRGAVSAAPRLPVPDASAFPAVCPPADRAGCEARQLATHPPGGVPPPAPLFLTHLALLC